MYVKRLMHNRCSISNSKCMWVPRSTGSHPGWPSSGDVALHFFLVRPLGFPQTPQGQYGSCLGAARISGVPLMSVTAPTHSQYFCWSWRSQPDAKEGSRAEKVSMPCSVRGMAAQCHLLPISHSAGPCWLFTGSPEDPGWATSQHWQWFTMSQARVLYPDPCSWPQV